LNELDDIAVEDRIVLELSSFQLETLNQIRRSPPVAVVTNFAPNHLDRHGSLADYRRAKQTLLRFQVGDDVAILNADDGDSSRWPTLARKRYFGSSGNPDALIDAAGISIQLHGRTWRLEPENPALQGPHNLANLAAASLAASVAGADPESANEAIRGFHGLMHRQQFVVEHHRRRFINDSKATTPEAAIAAIDRFASQSGCLILLAGGADKGVDLRSFAEQISRSVSAVALMGDTARPLEELLDRIRGPGGPERFRAASFESAFDWAVGQSASGDTVLLSPGCASFGLFDDFEARGVRFLQLVEDWTART
jgi:UDP-N-acetylmuramoylalanine--D-glutamate ligase